MSRINMIRRTFAVAMVVVALVPQVFAAAPTKKADPVSELYPDWQGLTAQSFICGREIGPSDLRHKVTIFVEVEAGEKLKAQLVQASPLVICSTIKSPSAVEWSTYELPRDVIAVVSVHGVKKPSDVTGIWEKKTLAQEEAAQIRVYRELGTSVYGDVTFTGAPESGGKYPFACVMGPGAGKEPLFKGELTATNLKEALMAVAKGQQQINGWEEKWRPFYGNIPAPRFNTSLAKALEKGRKAKRYPLEPIQKGLLADIKSSDEEKSKEAQVIFDAIAQTKSDLLLRIPLEAASCSCRAYYDIEMLLKYWPAERNRVESAIEKLQACPENVSMGKMFCKFAEWTSPEFVCKNAAEAKKIVQELKKMQKSIAKLKESQIISVQNNALLLDMKIEELLSTFSVQMQAK